MDTIGLIFPHQLFKQSPLFGKVETVCLVEEFLFFKQYKFHQQKIVFHRASMKAYESFLESKNIKVIYIEAIDDLCDIRKLISHLQKQGVSKIAYVDPVDDWLNQRIKKQTNILNIDLTIFDSPLFLNTMDQMANFFKKDKKKYYQTTFYKQQRKEKQILIQEDDEPVGGKWTFDVENRKKYPAKKTPPYIQYPDVDVFYEEAKKYVEKHFSDHLGLLSAQAMYPTNFKTTEDWLDQFLRERFLEFGTYEDAIVSEHSILNHSVLSPMLNIGLITVQEVVEKSLNFAKHHQTPINSVEGFIRQLIGWREFLRGVYEVAGAKERTTNFWGFDKKIPASFYNGTTGIEPVDQTIKKVLKTGYCHHIERLMILGNFMLLCEFDPDEVYKWFMELFIDAYDWVMVPNIYGMSQFADGGLMSTKPYISGSNYVIKMSNYKKGAWQEIWDGLFWRFMDKQRGFFKQNPRLGMLVYTFDKMDASKKENHLNNAVMFLDTLK